MAEQEKWKWQEPGTTWKGIGLYHITLTIPDRSPLLGSLEVPDNDPNKAKVKRTALGNALVNCLLSIQHYHPEVQVLHFCLMPDHLHAVLYVRHTMPTGIRGVTRGFWQAVKKLGRAWSASSSVAPNAIQRNNQAPSSSIAPNVIRRNSQAPSSSIAPNVIRRNNQAPSSSIAPNVIQRNTQAPSSSFAPNVIQRNTQAPSSSFAPNVIQENSQAPSSSFAPNVIRRNSQKETSHQILQDETARFEAFSASLREQQGEEIYYHLPPIFTDMPFIRPMGRNTQLPNTIRYIDMNPQRLATKRLRPGFFYVQRGIMIGGRSYDGVGNTTLLMADRFATVHVRSVMVKAAEQGDGEPLRNYKNSCVLAARKGVILISPFISTHEKQVMQVLLDEQHPFICLTDNGFRDYYKPSGALFDACAAGRVLILSPWQYDASKRHISRADCVALNGMAEDICNQLNGY